MGGAGVEAGVGASQGPSCLMASTLSYDSNLNASRDDKKNKFANTMEFVEDYLNNVVSEAVPFANEEKNKLTFEVAGGVPRGWGPWGSGWPYTGLSLHPGIGCGIPPLPSVSPASAGVPYRRLGFSKRQAADPMPGKGLPLPAPLSLLGTPPS